MAINWNILDSYNISTPLFSTGGIFSNIFQSFLFETYSGLTEAELCFL